jgi:hypothetical protein
VEYPQKTTSSLAVNLAILQNSPRVLWILNPISNSHFVGGKQ